MRYQVGLLQSAKELYKAEGTLGFYRGFQATIQREIPFACVQYPLYELLRRNWAKTRPDGQLEPWRGALCGSFAGGLTGFLTTPLDVIKTRVMLSSDPNHSSHPIDAMKQIFREGGLRRLFAGALPRTAWISLGGFIFFGAYEKSGSLLHKFTKPPSAI